MKSVDKNNAFTIVELIVAMGLLVILVGLSSAVFSTSVKAHRKAAAAIEITRSLNVLTEQLNADFDSLRKDAPVFIGFNRIGFDDDDPDTVADDYYLRFDTIHFFADDVFQTTRQYDYDNNNDGVSDGQKTISGNLARIYYGHANSDPSAPDYKDFQTLSRKSHILTTDADIFNFYGEIPAVTNYTVTPPVVDYTPFDDLTNGFGVTSLYSTSSTDENELEFNTITPVHWINALNYLDSGTTPANAGHFINYCMDDDSRPFIDLADYETLHLLMAQGVIEFEIQFAYTPADLNTSTLPGDFTQGIRWWPSVDPNGDGDESDSDFDAMTSNQFGVFFTLPNGTTNPNWFAIGNCYTEIERFKDTFYPRALKFTFRLRASNNQFPEGKTFTHIVTIN